MTKARDLANSAAAFSAVSATELGYVDGVTSAIQTQLDGKQAVNANVSTTELGYLDGVTSAIQTQVDAKIAKTLTSTTGDIIYASAANTPARLGIGSSAQILTVASGIPSWATPAGGGKVLQVVSAVITTATTIATTTMTDTAITLSITPTLNTSKVLVLINGLVNTTRSINTYGIASNVVRGSTDILTSGYDSYHGEIGSAGAIGFTNKLSYMFLDSPATTSSTTYKLQAQVFQTSSSHSSIWQKNSYPSVITLMEIGA